VDPWLDELSRELPALLILGPRACGKTTTVERRAATTVRLDIEAQAAAFQADPDAALRGLAEPVLLDEWQNAPGVLGAVRRSINEDPRPNRFFVTGSVRAELENEVWAGTGRLVRVDMYPMTMRELERRTDGSTFFDRVADGEELAVPHDPPDLRGYAELALRSGFPMAALLLSGVPRQQWLESYIDDLLTHDVEQIEDSQTRRRDRERLRRYFEAYVLNSAGAPEHKTLYDAAGINRKTAVAYDELVTSLLIAEQVPAWASNRLKRLTTTSKRYLIDPALIGAALRLDVDGVLGDGDLLGRVIDTFVASQLRPEAEIATTRPRIHHLRSEQGRREVDVLVELAGQRLIGIEVKASASPNADDARHLVWLRDQMEGRFVAGVVFHTGPRIYELSERIIAAPIAALWG
jgi:predicted AAA+ superfamily ATPase